MRSTRLLSNRVKKNTGNELATERYEYLSLENAEPDFGFPSSNDALIGSNSDGTRRFFTTSSGLSIDGSGVIRADETTLAIDTTGYKYSSSSTLRDVLTDLNTNTTSANTPSTIVFRDASGDFSANIITASSIQANNFISVVATGTAPFTVASTTKVDNLNADLFDDLTSIEFTLDRITGYGNSTTNTIDVGSVIAETIVGTNTATSAITQYDLITGTASLTSTISGYETITGTNTATSSINGFNSLTVANVVTPQITAATILNVNTGGDITLSTPANITLNATSGAIYTSSPIVDVTGTGSTFTADVINANNTTVADLIADNITALGYLRGPASFTIDPATHGDDTGTVVVAGSIQVNTNTSISGNLILDGDLTVSGSTTTVSATNLTLSDNMIMLNEPEERSIANAVGDGVNVVYTTTEDHNYFIGELVEVTGVTPSSFNVVSTSITAVTSNTFTIASIVTDTYVSGGTAKAKISTNPDLGITGQYDAGSGVVHSGIFRDATDERFKFFHEYVPEPDLSVFIDTTHPSFALANLEVNTLYGVDTELSGQLRGPANFVIDPAVHGNDSGSVQILGSLTVDGTITGNGSGLTNVNAATIDIAESTDPDNKFNIPFITSTGGGASGLGVQVDNGGLEFNPFNNQLYVNKISGNGSNLTLKNRDDNTAITIKSNRVEIDGIDGANDVDQETALRVYGADDTAEFVGLGVMGAGEAVITAGHAATLGTVGANTDLIFKNALNGAETETMRVTHDARLGIGITEPLAPLHVLIPGTTDAVIFESTDGGSVDGPDVIIHRNSTTPADLDNLGSLKFAGENSVGARINYSEIVGQAKVVADGTEEGNLLFKTDGITRMSLVNEFVGIGTAGPDKKLVVSGDGADAEIVINDVQGTPALRFRNAGVTSATIGTGTAGQFTIGIVDSAIHYDTGAFRPFQADDNTITLGASTARWKELYLAGTFNGPSWTNPNDVTQQLTWGNEGIQLNADYLRGTSAGVSKSIFSQFFFNNAIEDSGGVFDPGKLNVLAGANYRYTVSATNGGTGTSVSDNIFEGSSSNQQIVVADPANTEVVITVDGISQKTFTTYVGVTFGNPSFRAKDVKIETFRNGAWQTECDLIDQPQNTVVRQVSNNDGNGVTAVRYTFKNVANVAGSYFRINNLFLANFDTDYREAGYHWGRYHDNTVFSTTTIGDSNSLRFEDNSRIKVGTNDDLQIYHSGNDTVIGTVGGATGDLLINIGGSGVFRVNGTTTTEAMLRATENGSVELYHNGLQRLVTTQDGVSIVSAQNVAVTNLATAVSEAVLQLNGDTAAGTDALWFGKTQSDGSQYIQASNSAGTTPYNIRINPYGGEVVVGSRLVVLAQGTNEGGEILFSSGTPGIAQNEDFTVDNQSGSFRIFDSDTTRLLINSAGTATFAGGATFGSDVTVTGLLSATTKSFDIEHPTKENMRLRHGSLEGPENGVYVRGRLRDLSRNAEGLYEIVLPDYWRGLVDQSTITVNLTAMGRYNEMWVHDIEDYTVYVDSVYKIDCFYTIFGERKDVDKLTVEYAEV